MVKIQISKDYDDIPYFIPTNTISERYYSSKFKKIKKIYKITLLRQ